LLRSWSSGISGCRKERHPVSPRSDHWRKTTSTCLSMISIARATKSGWYCCCRRP